MESCSRCWDQISQGGDTSCIGQSYHPHHWYFNYPHNILVLVRLFLFLPWSLFLLILTIILPLSLSLTARFPFPRCINLLCPPPLCDISSPCYILVASLQGHYTMSHSCYATAQYTRSSIQSPLLLQFHSPICSPIASILLATAYLRTTGRGFFSYFKLRHNKDHSFSSLSSYKKNLAQTNIRKYFATLFSSVSEPFIILILSTFLTDPV